MEPTDLERLTVLNDEECMEGCEFHPIGVGGHGNVYKVRPPKDLVKCLLGSKSPEHRGSLLTHELK